MKLALPTSHALIDRPGYFPHVRGIRSELCTLLHKKPVRGVPHTRARVRKFRFLTIRIRRARGSNPLR